MRDAGWAMDLADEREAQAREACRPRVVVIGDAFVDEYVYADRVRLNPEAPTLCVTESRRETAEGGAANVAANLQRMLDREAYVFSLHPIGTDWPTKRRYVVDGRIVFRADENDRCEAIDTDRVRRACARAAAIVVADYGKGAVTDAVWRAVADAGVPVFAHTKGGPFDVQGRNRFSALRVVTWFVNEAEHAASAAAYAEVSGAVVTTLGVRGARSEPPSGPAVTVPAFPANVVDVCGAGDSFMAAYVAAWVRGERDVERLLRAGCAAGAAAVERFGTSVVSWDDVMRRLQPYATREEYDAQDGVDWDEVFDEVLL